MPRMTLTFTTTHQARCPICADIFLGPEIIFFFDVAICELCMSITSRGTLHALSNHCRDVTHSDEWSCRAGLAFWTPSEVLGQHRTPPWLRDSTYTKGSLPPSRD